MIKRGGSAGGRVGDELSSNSDPSAEERSVVKAAVEPYTYAGPVAAGTGHDVAVYANLPGR